MLVRVKDFNMEELLHYVKIFIKEIFNDHEVVLIEGTWEDSQGTNEHIRRLETIASILEKNIEKIKIKKRKLDE